MKVMFAILASMTVQYGVLMLWMALRILLTDAQKRLSHTENKGITTTAAHPSLSILIPIKNDREALTKLLAQLQDVPAELIVIDDHSSDGSAEIARERGIRVIANTGSGKRQALLTGLSHASGEVTITLDSDVALPQNWAAETLNALSQPNVDLWIFPVFIAPSRRLLNRFEALDALSLTATTAAFAYQNRAIMGSGAFMACKTNLLREALNRINDQLPSGDDTFVVQFIRAEKRTIKFVSSVSVSVVPQGTLKDLLRQRVRWGYKTPHYTDELAIFTAWLVFFANFSWLVALIFAVLGEPAFWTLVAAKPMLDALVLVPTMRHFKQWQLLPVLPLALVIYPFYLVAVASWAILAHPEVIQKQWR
jgi:glycosyltransferase involved in cell wall biosynthesis